MPFGARRDEPEIVVRSCRSVLAQNGTSVTLRSELRVGVMDAVGRGQNAGYDG
jgi:hypothetical protein